MKWLVLIITASIIFAKPLDPKFKYRGIDPRVFNIMIIFVDQSVKIAKFV